MVSCFVHLDDDARDQAAGEEVYVFVPEATKTVIRIPLVALPAFLPLLAAAVGCDSPPTCPACASSIPRFSECRGLR
jgi:hypothetical protein